MRRLAVVAAIAALGAPRGAEPPVRADVARLIQASGADVAVAFRTLDGRDELLIQPDVEFHAASTMKVPVMIELYRQVRAGLLKLDQQIPVVNEFHSIVDGSPYKLDVGDDSDAEVYKHVGGRMSYRALCEARDRIAAGVTNPASVKAAGLMHIPAGPQVRLEYLEVVDPDDMPRRVRC